MMNLYPSLAQFEYTYLHFFQDCGAIICNDHFSIRTEHDLLTIQTNHFSYLTSILSMPFGPREVFSRLATVRAAIMLTYNQSYQRIQINCISKHSGIRKWYLQSRIRLLALTLCASSPLTLFFFSCSLRIMNGLPFSSNAKLICIVFKYKCN